MSIARCWLNFVGSLSYLAPCWLLVGGGGVIGGDWTLIYQGNMGQITWSVDVCRQYNTYIASTISLNGWLGEAKPVHVG